MLQPSQAHLALPQRQGHVSPGRYRPQLGQNAPQARNAVVEMKEMSRRVAPERNEQASTISAEDQAVRDQIEQIVRKQLAAQDAQDKFVGKKPQRPTVGALVGSELELLKKQMSLTDNHFHFGINKDSELWDDVAKVASTRKVADDAKSVRSTKTGKTMFTTKSKYAAAGVKLVSTQNLAPVGMSRLNVPPAPVGPQKQSRYNAMIKSVLGTENLIEKILEIFEQQEDQVQWPADAEPNPLIEQTLSYTKMINEINHLEPRAFTNTGLIQQYPLGKSRTGWHSTDKRWRRSDLEQLGIGVNLYFKMLKYFSLLFLLFFVLSIPSMVIYGSG